MTDCDDKAWFAPKRYGYGAGLPIAPQGWAVLLGYLGCVALAMIAFADAGAIRRPAFLAIFIPLTLTLIIITARKTRGGWRWRWGEED